MNRNDAPQAERNNAGGLNLKTIIMYALLGFTLMNAFGALQPKVVPETGASADQESDKTSSEGTAVNNRAGAAHARAPAALKPFAQVGDAFSIVVSVDDDLFEPIEFDNLKLDPESLEQEAPTRRVSMDMVACVKKNCSAEVHVTWIVRGKTFHSSTPLVRFYGTKVVEKHRLIGGSNSKETEDPAEAPAHQTGDMIYRGYLLPYLTISPVSIFASPLPPQLEPFTTVDEETHTYAPVVYINDFWIIRDHMRELNASTAAGQTFELNVTIAPLSMMKFLMYKQFEASMKSQMDMGLSSGDAGDEVKRIFLDTNPYFLALTALVTMLHMLFEYLAFANDIKFWRGRKDFKGLSLRSIAINCYFQTVIFLYLVDSNEASWTILLPSGFGVLAEYWKLAQCMVLSKRTPTDRSSTTQEVKKSDEEKAGTDGRDRGKPALSLFGYDLHFSDSYDQRTRGHDDTAIRWLTYIMIPVLLGYSVYSAVYNEHKNWYSYLISTQVQFIYFFGFAMMTPQIFINYKLKSVGQLPWRTFVYKALNTVIDDLFAFIIKMPWLHRIACFRDDVVFVILLYQRWIYPVDMNRMADDDENGGSVEDENKDAEEKKNQ